MLALEMMFKLLKNKKGQMAIFLALIFQVLFVFFAMVINIGLVVHDKINLQNSVDMAAYYGAQRQAEILNHVAHINFQMRQVYKLFVWRFRVLGQISLKQETGNVLLHPIFTGGGADTEYPNPNGSAVTCIASTFWDKFAELESGQQSNLCMRVDTSIPNIPALTGGFGIAPGYTSLQNFVDQIRQDFNAICKQAGVINFTYAATILAAYRADIAVRKKMIVDLASKLNQGEQDFPDMMGGSTKEGVEKTFKKNLTEGHSVDQFEMSNSMGISPCNRLETWLPEITINPILAYIDYDGNSIETCVGNKKINRGQEGLPAHRNEYPISPILEQHWVSEFSGEMRSAIGYEKNPWCLTYVGVKAQTQVTAPFSPMGGAVTLTARGFAAPFGGRVGPWYGKSWPQGAPTSQGTRGDNTLVDQLLPSRGDSPTDDPNGDWANYSRYPGDTLGMQSIMGLGELSNFASSSGLSMTSLRGRFSLNQYSHLGVITDMESHGDSLARNAVQRDWEKASLFPDLFDITYYSISPKYYEYFMSGIRFPNGGFTSATPIFDVGSSKGGESPQEYSVFDLINDAATMVNPEVFYRVKKWEHLLTDWVQFRAADYSFPQDKFGQCYAPSPANVPALGNCITGGQVGYSIKLVSKDFLQSGNLPIGGSDVGGGAISNPPSD